MEANSEESSRAVENALESSLRQTATVVRDLLHNALFLWEQLSKELKEYDVGPAQNIPDFLAAADYEVIQAEPNSK